MSPTSYQAAPPRVSTIADARVSVKPLQTGSMIPAAFRGNHLPLVVRRTLERRDFARVRMNIDQSRARLIRAQHDAVVLLRPVRRTGHRILGDPSKGTRLHQIVPPF